VSNEAQAQQDAQASMYMFNPLQFNPAYAGSRGAMNATLVNRAQWVGVDGAPLTQFASIHAPIARKRIGVGGHISNDHIGAKYNTAVFADIAVSQPLSRNARLNFGVSAGMDMYNFNFTNLNPNDPTDNLYLVKSGKVAFNTGVGLYFHTKRFYAGASVPRLMNATWNNVNLAVQHIFLSAGYVYPINTVTDLKLSSLIKVVKNAPVTVDLNANVFFYKKFWIGGMYRYNESFGLNMAIQLQEKWMFGYSYDYVYNQLRATKNMGTHEIMLTYDMNGRRSIYASPRYF
jgi:type IX secretion system PorP/SprF family membrane protein